MSQGSEHQVIARNRRARHDYRIEDTYEAGMVLLGSEVKSLRESRATLTDGFAIFDGGELWLEAVHIPEYGNASWTNHLARRRRKLLLHHRELQRLWQKSRQAGVTIIPLQLYFSSGRVKVEIALATGKREYDKRHALREAQDKREAQRAMRAKNRGVQL